MAAGDLQCSYFSRPAQFAKEKEFRALQEYALPGGAIAGQSLPAVPYTSANMIQQA